LALQTIKVDQAAVKAHLLNIFNKNASPEARQWLATRLQEATQPEAQARLYTSFSAATRYAGKSRITLEEAETAEAGRLLPGFAIQGWTLAQLARTLLVLHYQAPGREAYVNAIETLFSTADMGELVALYAALPLLPYPESYVARAGEGVRTNMGDVLESIMLNNPYPAAYLAEGAWNQMVLKAVFTGKPLYKIWGLDDRSNPSLSVMLNNYAHERWAAGRFVTPELWRPLAYYMTPEMLKDIEKVSQLQEEIYRQAAMLACAHSNLPEAKQLLNRHTLYKEQIENGYLTWDRLGREWVAPQF
jgi:hypothetical protein